MKKLTDEERSIVEHARSFAAQALTGPPATFGEVYKKLVAIIDRLVKR